MIVQFNVNLGSVDAAKVGLDFRQCLQGSQVECEGAAGKWLVERGIASDVTPPPPAPEPEPEQLQAVPAEEEALEAVPTPEPKSKRK